jgi:DoxX-like family
MEDPMKTLYWVATALICVVMSASAFRYVTGSLVMVEKFRHLGYPDYFRQLLGVAKALGVLALVVPRTPATLREWAYAGFTFDLIAAVASHLLVGDAVLVSFLPGLLLIPLLTSHHLVTARFSTATESATPHGSSVAARESGGSTS